MINYKYVYTLGNEEYFSKYDIKAEIKRKKQRVSTTYKCKTSVNQNF